MKLTDITEKKSTYWRTSEKKPKLSKPSKFTKIPQKNIAPLSNRFNEY